MNIDFFETAVIRKWSGKWIIDHPALPVIDAPSGGYVITFHKGLQITHKAEHYHDVDTILNKYDYYCWQYPYETDEKDIVMVGIK